MKKLLHEIRKQDHGVRQTMFALSFITVISLIGMVWFRNFQHDMFVLLNPEPEIQSQFFAETGQVTSLFGYIGGAIKNASADLYNLVRGHKKMEELIIENRQNTDAVHLLPIPAGKK